MNDRKEIPEDFVPYPLLDVLGNKFVNGLVPVATSTSAVLLIGKGNTPSVWLSAPNQSDPKMRTYVVEANKSRSPDIEVHVQRNETVVSFHGTVMVRAQQIAPDSAVIKDLDLRPVGLNVYKEGDAIRIGSTLIQHNEFKNVDTMIVIRV